MARTLALLGLAAAVLALAAPAHGRDLQVGIADDAILLNGSPDEARATVAEWKRLGVDVVRLQVVWSRIAPEPGAYAPPAGFDPGNHQDARYRWGDVDRAVRMLAAAGLKPMLMLDGPPPLWASGKPPAGNPRYQPSAWHFGRFAAAVAARYGEFADEYVLWNEPNLPVWIQPQARCRGGLKKVKRGLCTPVSPHVYRYMVRAAYPEVHANDPQARVLIGALAPAGSQLKSRNANMRPLQFLRAFGCVTKRYRRVRTSPCHAFEPATADGIAYHPHSTKHPPHEDYPRPGDAALADLAAVERVVDRLQRTGRLVGTTTPLNLWLDEYGYQTNPPDKERGVTPGRQDRYLQQAAYVAWRDPRVQLIAQYLWRDEPVGGGKRYTGWQSGLVTHEGREKPALAHFDDPMFVDLDNGVIWGQIRPGGAHDVEVQVRAPGALTEWRTLARLRTAGDGSWYLKQPPQVFSAYRAVYDGGRTTGTWIAAPLVARNEGPEGTEVSSDGLLVERRAVEPVPGSPVPPSFAGLSIEWWSTPDYVGAGGAVNPLFARLTDLLGRAGNGPPTLRLGGDSTDHSWWNPEGAPRPAGISDDLSQPFFDHLRAWVDRTGTPLVLGLNMGLDDPARAAAMAGAARATLPEGSIRAFELGNEPDLYASPRNYWVGDRFVSRTQKRPATYGYPEYRDEVTRHVQAIRPAAPDVGLSAGGFAGASWDDLQDDVLAREQAIRTWGMHAYPLPTCDRDIRRRGGARYIPKLLSSGAYAPIIDRARHLNAVATSYGAKVIASEINSAICGGLAGVSDTYASALWGTDILFGLAAEGVRNVDFHTWTGSHYGPLEFSRRRGRPVAEVRPLFYAMWLFNRATPKGSRLLQIGPNPTNTRLKTWGTVDRAGVQRFVVINKDRTRGRKVVLTPGGGAARASVERLSAPTIGSRTKVTLGGLGFGEVTRDGVPRGRRTVERLVRRGGKFRLDMPPAGAALVTVPRR